MAAEEEGEGLGELYGQCMVAVERVKERRERERDEGEDCMVWSSRWSYICIG